MFRCHMQQSRHIISYYKVGEDTTLSLETTSLVPGEGKVAEREVIFSLSVDALKSFGEDRNERAGDARCFLGVPGMWALNF